MESNGSADCSAKQVSLGINRKFLIAEWMIRPIDCNQKLSIATHGFADSNNAFHIDPNLESNLPGRFSNKYEMVGKTYRVDLIACCVVTEVGIEILLNFCILISTR
jgi:hypothetical protein